MIGTLLAIAGAVSAFSAGKALSNRGSSGQPLAPGPTTTVGSTTPPPVPDATLAASNAAIAAQAAASKQRAKAAGGDSLILGTPGARTPGTTTAPRTLVGF